MILYLRCQLPVPASFDDKIIGAALKTKVGVSACVPSLLDLSVLLYLHRRVIVVLTISCRRRRCRESSRCVQGCMSMADGHGETGLAVHLTRCHTPKGRAGDV